MSFTAGRVTRKGSRASAPVTEHFTLPLVGAWNPATQVKLVQRKGKWLVSWTPATINPGCSIRAITCVVSRQWPARAGIFGAKGAPLVTSHDLVTVGIVGNRVKDAAAVSADLLAAGATQAEVKQALALAKAHPGEFDPVFQITQARFEQLKSKPGPNNVYAVPGTSFQLTGARTAITAQLAAHVVGLGGPDHRRGAEGAGLPLRRVQPGRADRPGGRLRAAAGRQSDASGSTSPTRAAIRRTG